jgi:hypothetical protein
MLRSRLFRLLRLRFTRYFQRITPLLTKAGEIVAVRPSLGLENANRSAAALKHNIAGTDKA